MVIATIGSDSEWLPEVEYGAPGILRKLALETIGARKFMQDLMGVRE